MESQDQESKKYSDLVMSYESILKSIRNDPKTFNYFRYETVRVLENIQTLLIEVENQGNVEKRDKNFDELENKINRDFDKCVNLKK